MTDDTIISFRLSTEEIAALKVHRKPMESLSLSAKRLLRELLQISTAKYSDPTSLVLVSVDNVVDTHVNNAIDKIVDSERLEERIESILEERVTSLVVSLNQKFADQEERLEALEKIEA